ncbi:hypothetical protein [Actinomadura sp. 6N118]|uniref:hypothetical protein n=1 Tax=Actinomadura sp. 6N118 TaxID=3375151 RepID=UPI0037C11B99
MAGLWTAFIGVLGTLAGVSLTYWFQRKGQHTERLRQERMLRYGDFAVAIMEYRRTQMDRWRDWGDETGERSQERFHDLFRTRSAAWGAYYRVRLISDSPPVVTSAKEALDLVTAIKQVRDAAELEALSERCREAVAHFTDIAAPEIQGRSQTGPDAVG